MWLLCFRLWAQCGDGCDVYAVGAGVGVACCGDHDQGCETVCGVGVGLAAYPQQGLSGGFDAATAAEFDFCCYPSPVGNSTMASASMPVASRRCRTLPPSGWARMRRSRTTRDSKSTPNVRASVISRSGSAPRAAAAREGSVKCHLGDLRRGARDRRRTAQAGCSSNMNRRRSAAK